MQTPVFIIGVRPTEFDDNRNWFDDEEGEMKPHAIRLTEEAARRLCAERNATHMRGLCVDGFYEYHDDVSTADLRRVFPNRDEEVYEARMIPFDATVDEMDAFAEEYGGYFTYTQVEADLLDVLEIAHPTSQNAPR